MGGFFGTISNGDCITDLFYGTDYNSHLGTRRGGMATYDKEEGFTRSIHNLLISAPSLNRGFLNSKEMPGSVLSAIRMRSQSLSTLT
jgi:hypothetical protein